MQRIQSKVETLEDKSEPTIFSKRRNKLFQKIKPNSIVILPSSPVSHRNADIEYNYRQNSNFYYLTGFEEPESVAVFITTKTSFKYILFNLPNDAAQETITGKRAGQEGACKIYGADESFQIQNLKDMLPLLMKGKQEIHYPFRLEDWGKTISAIIPTFESDVRHGFKPHFTLNDITHLINEMRAIKDDKEISLIKKAVDISMLAHTRAMKVCTGLYEYNLQAEVMYEFLSHGALGTAYPPIIGSGPNSCVLHHDINTRKINDGDMVLVDVGAEYKNYAADITRTFPANGKFNDEQRAIYKIVLKAQEAGIDTVYPGSSWKKVTEVIERIVTQGLMDLGLLTGDLEKLLKQKAFLPFYMHGPGHWLGLDVHDAGRYKVIDVDCKFEVNMLLTIEPGIYISDTIKDIPDKYRNIGVRIEDDVLVTSDGREVLSEALPKQISEIEKIMKNQVPTLFPIQKKIDKKKEEQQSWKIGVKLAGALLTGIGIGFFACRYLKKGSAPTPSLKP